MLTLTELCEMAKLSARDVENWTTRLALRTTYQPTVRGKARLYTKANALELVLMSAMVDVGVAPSRAVPFADACRRYAAVPGALRDWLLFPVGGDFDTAIATNDPDVRGAAETFGTTSIIAIPVRALVEKVEMAFETEAVA